MAQMLLMMQKTFDEQLKFQREQQKCQDSKLPPLEKIPEIDWTYNDGLHSHYTIWKEQWNCYVVAHLTHNHPKTLVLPQASLRASAYRSSMTPLPTGMHAIHWRLTGVHYSNN